MFGAEKIAQWWEKNTVKDGPSVVFVQFDVNGLDFFVPKTDIKKLEELSRYPKVGLTLKVYKQRRGLPINNHRFPWVTDKTPDREIPL
jgi:hypothetical protein